MKKALLATLAILLLVAGLVIYRICVRLRQDTWTVIELYTIAYSERGSAQCGHVTNSFYHGSRVDPQIAITCAQTALANHRAFTLMYTGYGTDEGISSAIIARKDGTAEEIFYATGTVDVGNRLVKHRCDFPTRLVIEKDSPFGFPRLHCAEWPPINERLTW